MRLREPDSKSRHFVVRGKMGHGIGPLGMNLVVSVVPYNELNGSSLIYLGSIIMLDLILWKFIADN